MNTTLTHLNARRSWLIRDLNVYGSIAADTFVALATEIDDLETRVVSTDFILGGTAQLIPFTSLTDHRGNQLPNSIDTPVIIPITKNAIPVAVIGQPTPTSFRLAKTTAAPEDAIVDLWIIEART